MTSLYVGTRLDASPSARYRQTLPFAEISPASPLPKPNKLRRWATDLPEGFVVSLLAPASVYTTPRGPLRPGEDLDRGIEWLHEAASALRAKFVLIATSREIQVGQRDRDLLQAFFERIRGAAPYRVFHPAGLWEADETVKFAKKLDALPTFDPLETDAPDAEILYARLNALGGRSRFGEDAMLDTIETILSVPCGEAYVAIHSPNSFQEAERLQALMSEASELAASGTSPQQI